MSPSRRLAPRLAVVAAFAALCGIATFWALQLLAPAAAIAPSGSMVDLQKAPDLTGASRLFGVPASGDAQQSDVLASNIKVLGVVASANRGSAVLSIDGQVVKAFGVGDGIDERTKLVEVRPDIVVIEQGGARIELPAPKRPDVALLSAGPAAASSSESTPPAPVGATPRAPTAPPPGSMQPGAPGTPPADPGDPSSAAPAPSMPPADGMPQDPGAAPSDPGDAGAPPPEADAPPDAGDAGMVGADNGTQQPGAPVQPANPPGAGGMGGAGGFRGGIRGSGGFGGG